MLNLNYLYDSVEAELRRNVIGKYSIYYSVTPRGEITREIPVQIVDVIKLLTDEIPESNNNEAVKIHPVIVGCCFKFKAVNLMDNSIMERDARCFTGELFETREEAELLVEFSNKDRVIRYE